MVRYREFWFRWTEPVTCTVDRLVVSYVRYIAYLVEIMDLDSRRIQMPAVGGMTPRWMAATLIVML